MKKLVTAVTATLALAASVPVMAEPAFDRDFIVKISGDVYRAYREEGPAGMLDLERSCWAEMSEKDIQTAQVCAQVNMTGIVIEESIAQSRGRQPVYTYNVGVAMDRAKTEMGRVGLPEESYKAVMKGAAQSMVTIVMGLQAAGMR